MDDTVSLILHGCKLAEELALNLANLANQPENLSKSCEEIIRVFAGAKERLSFHQLSTTSYPHPMLFREPQDLQHQQNIDPNLQEWLGSSCTSAMETLLHQTPGVMAERSALGLIESKVGGMLQMGSGGLFIESSSRSDAQAMDPSDSGRGSSSSSKRPRKRNDDAGKRTVRVPAQLFGNTEIPPEDGFTWRKYGQKEILGSKFPRAYYRCTHQNLYHCPAKKQVQRLDDDPFQFEVVYRGEHTCHMSDTAPSFPRPATGIAQEMAQAMIGQPPPSAATSLGRWVDFSLGPGGSAGSSSSSMAAGSSGGAAGPSTGGRYGKEADYPIAELADAMFNSGSSSTNSMELIFPGDQPSDKNN
ncbi:WRKY TRANSCRIPTION FACTOR 21-RELATED [Salix purpurea]|uniref:WRKY TRANSCRIPTION FACTOR 21-RELATED n=1 Tax=Salix purpurea TaxID=77065 RepID=A0A9Q0ZRV7_SALPP|nr:WRKY TRANSCRIPTION FACTOR 21-RELATED [Salix purpurea]